MTMRTWASSLVLLVCTLAMVEGTVSDAPSPARTLAVVCFLVIAPGLAVVRLLRLSDPWVQAALVPALSLSIDAVVGGGLSYAGLWSPSAAVIALAVFSVGGAVVADVCRAVRRKP
jgi:hypothetical protein